ncbi:RICIN domain-containing protein [Streptomyces atratus]|uniref:RICIN domain-containing protein n=1 Tax=Streptomyces atratus TaxID=1893 RepID=UPI0036C3DB3C
MAAGPEGQRLLLHRVRHTGKCLSVPRSNTANGGEVVQWDCVDATNQHFRLG